MLTVNVLTVTVKNSVEFYVIPLIPVLYLPLSFMDNGLVLFAFLLVEQHGYGYNFGLNFGLLSVGNYNLLYYFTL
jgi:hypothetical protein